MYHTDGPAPNNVFNGGDKLADTVVNVWRLCHNRDDDDDDGASQ